MRNYLIIDFGDGEANKCLAQISNKYENSINIAFYPYAVGDECTISTYDSDYTLLDSVVFSAAEEVNYFSPDPSYFPMFSDSLYIRYESSSYTSEYIEFSFLAGLKSYQYNMMVEMDSDVKYRVFFRKTMSADEVTQWIEGTEVTVEENTQNISTLTDTVKESVSVDDALIESLTTNLTKYILKPRIEKKATGWEWKDFVTNPDSTVTYTPCFTGSSSDKIRNYINIEDQKIKFVSEQLTVPSDYSKIDESDTVYLTDKGQQLYFKSLDNLSGGYTTISPRVFDKTITSYVEDMYKCRKLSSAGTTEWNIEIYQSISASGTPGETALNKTVGIKFDDTCKVEYNSSTNTLQSVITNKTDYKQRGLKTDDTGVYYSNDGDNWILIGSKSGGNVVIVDHTPTAEDVSGDDCVFVQYDPEATPIVTTDSRQIIGASNVWVEVEYVPPEPIAITPATAVAAPGDTVQFSCNYEDAEWSVNSPLSSISSGGLLSVASNEVLKTLTVTATSVSAPSPGTATAEVTVSDASYERVQRSNFNARLTELWRQYYGEYASSSVTQLNYGTAYLNEASYVEVYWGANPSVNNSFLTLAYDSNGKILQPTGSQGQYYSRFNHSGQSNMGYNTAAIGATIKKVLQIYD